MPHDRADRIDRRAYPFESRWSDLPQGRMHYVDEGAGEPIVFVHGTPTWSFEWRHLIADLRSDHRCIAVDHLGFGLSERPSGFAYTPEAHAEAFAAFVQGLDLPPFTLVVHDFGGPIALPLALHRPARVRRLVVVNSWMWSLRGERALERAAKVAASPLGRLLYERLNASPRLLMPSAYADRRRLTRRSIGTTSTASRTGRPAARCCGRWRARCSARAITSRPCGRAARPFGPCRRRSSGGPATGSSRWACSSAGARGSLTPSSPSSTAPVTGRTRSSRPRWSERCARSSPFRLPWGSAALPRATALQPARVMLRACASDPSARPNSASCCSPPCPG
jgi:pimeloyl-ACP methyl ester carboxylesterase